MVFLFYGEKDNYNLISIHVKGIMTFIHFELFDPITSYFFPFAL